MRLRIVLIAFIAALGTGAAQNPVPADAAHAKKIADIRKLMELTGGDKAADQMFEMVSANMRATGGPVAASSEHFLQEFKKELDFKQIVDIVAAAYDKYLSAEDVREMIRFYETPAGKHMLTAMPAINAEMLRQIMPISQAIAQKVMKRMQEEEGKE